MREIYQGMFWGYELVLKVPEEEYDRYQKFSIKGNTFENYIKERERYAVEQYKQEQMLKKMSTLSKFQKLIFKLFTKS